MLNPEKFDKSILQIFPAHLSDVGTLLWDTKESHFSTLLFIYFRLFTFLGHGVYPEAVFI